MIYKPDKLVIDFAQRTQQNLRLIENMKSAGEEVYEVTHLINSMLGLLVFPQQKLWDTIKPTPLTELEKKGWPRIEVIEGELKSNDLRQLIRMLRNGITHCNVEFFPDDQDRIAGFYLWNKRKGKITWKVRLD